MQEQYDAIDQPKLATFGSLLAPVKKSLDQLTRTKFGTYQTPIMF